ncbi:protein SidG [Legionella sainthelensi]|uniref:protein SidG n=1 Tax=Legionella sainthelensi TaxID=28087 RepID=UPI000E1FC9FB|nr:protein SidG [Legionella sainthelensi]
MSNSKDEIEISNDSLFGITVQTWGTKSRASNGMLTFADQQLFGGDVGHASINMKLPVTSTTKEWIENYCYKQTYEEYKKSKGEDISYEKYLEEADKLIPITLTNQITRVAKYDSSGIIFPTNEKAYEQIYFDIDWSWWPGRIQNTNDDMIWEREGKHFAYDEKWKEILEPEQRLHRGKLGSRLMDYAPSAIIHQRDIPSCELDRITRKHQINQIEEKLNLINLLSSKIDVLSSAKISPSMELMFKNLGMNINHILHQTKEKGTDLSNLSDFKQYLSTCLYERRSELEIALHDAEKGIKTEDASKNIENAFYEIQNQLEDVQKQIEHIEQQQVSIEKLLKEFEKDDSDQTPYTVEIDKLVQSLPFLKDAVQLENSSLSPKSIENLIEYIDILKSKLSDIQSGKNDQYLKLIEKYEHMCKQYEDDDSGLADALWEEGIEENDIKQARKELLQSENPEIAKLTHIQEQLRSDKHTGLLLSRELEESFNDSVKEWKSKLDAPCQRITKESKKSIISQLEQRQIELTKEKGSLPETENKLKDELAKIEIELFKIKEFSEFYSDNASAYMVIGLPPDHQVSLPLAMNGNRGLHPLAMLQKMNELASPGAKKFDLQTHNCSLTSIEVLSAGAVHDPLLKSILEKRALGFFGTPQQVLENAKAARNTISEGKQFGFFSPLITHRPLEHALGYSVERYMTSATPIRKNANLALVALVALAKTPNIFFRGLVNPKEQFEDILYNLNLIYDRNSTSLKVGATLLAAPALLVSATLAAAQTGAGIVGSTINKPFHYIRNLFNQNPINTDEVTAPMSNEKMQAALLHRKIKSNIDENTLIIDYHESPKKLIDEFELKLEENPNKVVILSPEAHDSVLNFIMAHEDVELKQKFYSCCTQSLMRIQKFTPKTTEETDELVQEAAAKFENQTPSIVQKQVVEPQDTQQEEPIEESRLTFC